MRICYYGLATTQMLLCLLISHGHASQNRVSATVEDFVVECNIATTAYAYQTGRQKFDKKVFVLNSDDKAFCGTGAWSGQTSVIIEHPVYSLPIETRKIAKEAPGNNINHIILRMLHWRGYNQQIKLLYESGYWDDTPDPIEHYLNNIRNCEITDHYLKLYNEVKTPDYEILKKRYYKDIIECNRYKEALQHKLATSSNGFYYSRIKGEYQPCPHIGKCNNKKYLPELTIKNQATTMWSQKRWVLYLKKKKLDRKNTKKSTYLVAYDHPDGGGVWFLMDAFSKEQIKEKYPEFTPFDDRPQWMSMQQKASFVQDCNNIELHWDIEKPVTGWLLEYKQGKKIRPCEKVKYIHINQGIIR